MLIIICRRKKLYLRHSQIVCACVRCRRAATPADHKLNIYKLLCVVWYFFLYARRQNKRKKGNVIVKRDTSQFLLCSARLCAARRIRAAQFYDTLSLSLRNTEKTSRCRAVRKLWWMEKENYCGERESERELLMR